MLDCQAWKVSTRAFEASKVLVGSAPGLSKLTEAVPFYKKFGFVQLTPPRMMAGGMVAGVRNYFEVSVRPLLVTDCPLCTALWVDQSNAPENVSCPWERQRRSLLAM